MSKSQYLCAVSAGVLLASLLGAGTAAAQSRSGEPRKTETEVGENVRVSAVAIQQGNLTITVRESPQVSQPAPFSRGGTTTVVPQSDLSVDEEKGKKFVTLKSGASLATMVAGLNALGVTPRDMISILQSIKTAGALQADIDVQ